MAPSGVAAPGPTNVVILSKIPAGTTEQQISAGAGRPDEVLQVSFRPADPDGPGWAIIAFSSPEVAKGARDRLDGKPLLGMPPGAALDAAIGEGLLGKIRLGNDQDSPWKEARTATGQVYYYHAVTRQTTWIKPPPDFTPQAPPGVPRSQNTSYSNPGAQAQAAIKAAVSNVEASKGGDRSDNPTGSSTNGPIGSNLFVYHIPNSWDDGILRQHFEHFGSLVSCRVQTDESGRPRGFGFVSYDAPAGAQAAIAGMHGFPVEGKWLKVQLKKGDEQEMNKDKASLGGGSLAGTTDGSGPTQVNLPPPPKPPVVQPSAGSIGDKLRQALTGGKAPGAPPAGRPGPY
eukprot:TRINITY_DN6241_c0_g2_i2.p1 TRINITY_DN6241_c0_g2~~TRINITY_DN6241_c0_g2_i2.p1  ORF type:complete len:344 (-),score=88.09 TRINITY_DN6241_c0_g2_i2:641-1672(-)